MHTESAILMAIVLAFSLLLKNPATTDFGQLPSEFTSHAVLCSNVELVVPCIDAIAPGG